MQKFKAGFVIALATVVLALPAAQAGQPRMKDALDRLREARAALASAEHNKNGHRERAMELVDRAIAEVEAGMAAAR